MKKLLVSCVLVLATSGIVSADTFGTGANQFDIDFVNISASTNPASGIPAGDGFILTGVNNDYRMGTYEIANDQWNKFVNAYGTVTGSPSNAYDDSPYWPGTNVPTNYVSWYEGAQFVNWLNTSTGHQAAYKFTGTKGTSNYTFDIWSVAEAAGGTNLYRHKDAFYFLPTEDEWVKAAYWNGTNLQTYATIDDSVPIAGVDTNYDQDPPHDDGPWNVGSGSEELNGTFDMMGNVWEWMESPLNSGDYLYDSPRVFRGGSYAGTGYDLSSSFRIGGTAPDNVGADIGLRVASVPEPCTISLLALGGLVLHRKRLPGK